tara:strand:- start:127 stop:663 length:537 start_codon:yes stop_codon:yes gene_type:complete
MKCNRKNKKLMNNIAIVILALIIFYIIKNVFFNKQIEGFGGKEIYEYEGDAVTLKLDIAVDPTTAAKFSSYVNIYKNASDRRLKSMVREEEEEESDNSKQDNEDFLQIEKIYIAKMGSATYYKLKNAYFSDPETEIFRLNKEKKADNSGKIKVAVSGLIDKINDLYSEMSKDGAKLGD